MNKWVTDNSATTGQRGLERGRTALVVQTPEIEHTEELSTAQRQSDRMKTVTSWWIYFLISSILVIHNIHITQ